MIMTYFLTKMMVLSILFHKCVTGSAEAYLQLTLSTGIHPGHVTCPSQGTHTIQQCLLST